MRLLLLRHAIAVPRGTPGIADDRRPLTRRGVRRFERAARGLARHCPAPEWLLSSPLLRARQTAALAARAWGGLRVTLEPALADGDFERLAAALDARRGAALVVAVGHEPHLSHTLARLLGASRPELLELRKGGAALVELPGRVVEGGRLLWLASPRLLRAVRRHTRRPK